MIPYHVHVTTFNSQDIAMYMITHAYWSATMNMAHIYWPTTTNIQSVWIEMIEQQWWVGGGS